MYELFQLSTIDRHYNRKSFYRLRHPVFSFTPNTTLQTILTLILYLPGLFGSPSGEVLNVNNTH